ncbi:uncharacterized protein LOC142326011 isoform X2 [Lycorma delicatula]|uniref:uncharacterized protein LOC142326011 isoform X2 n=1 Tax=Lycorma delicatula TaxID=130591 RepID=UPI003F510B16
MVNGEYADSLPNSVCSGCVHYLQEIDEFAAKCARVQELFYSLALKLDDKVTEFGHLLINNSDDIMKNQESVKLDNDSTVYGKKYETVPIDQFENEDKVRRGVCKRKGKTSLNGRNRKRGRPRKCDRIVPRIRIRAVQQPVCNNISSDIVPDNEESHDNEVGSDVKSGNEQSVLVGAAKRKSKVPQNVIPNRIIQNDRCCESDKSKEEESEDFVEVIGNEKEVSADGKEEATVLKKLRKSELKALVPSLYHFKCHICEYVCKNWNSLRTHCKDLHREIAQLTCDCGKTLSTRAAIIEHRARHTDSNVYKCDKCEKTFHRKSLLTIHVMSHVPKEEQPFVCCKCARRFHCEALLRNHERVHLPKEERLIFPCRLCQKMFSSKSAVSTHMKAVHLRERPFVCDQCGHSFTSKGILQEHLTIHSDDAPWNCSKCNKKFKTKYRLKIHMDTHRETPYQCPKCPVLLSTRRTLRMHLVVHRDTKAYQCPTCGKAFRRAKDLKNHNNLHTGRRPYTCPFCSRTFANGSNCRSHKRRMHPEELRILESSNAVIENGQTSVTEGEINVNENVGTVCDKKDVNGVTSFNMEYVPQISEPEQRKNDFPVTPVFSCASSFLSFTAASDRRYSPVKQSTGLLRSSFNHHFTMDPVGSNYSPCHDQDISSSAVPAFPGNPYIHHQSLIFNRGIEPS